MRLFITFLFSFFSLNSFSQSGKIEGKVTDARTGLALSGVSVTATSSEKGNATDINGGFVITLTPGTYTIRLSSVGYQIKEVSDVIVTAGAVTNLDFILESVSKTESEVVVTSSRRQETTLALISYQKNTNTVAQVVSAEAIRRSPDRNTGEVLKRIPGTSIQDGKYLVVRGLADRYNQAMLNGILLSSTEPDRKTFSFDLFPSSIIDNIIINKAFVPELPGEWAGGIIQVNTKDVPAQNFINLQIGTGFNTQTVGKDFYSYKGDKYDFLGFDNGSRALPSSFPKKAEFNNLTAGEKTSFANSFSNVWKAIPKGDKVLPLLAENL